jgi:N-acetylglutamate synthase-like GNAT family acetyltransferase
MTSTHFRFATTLDVRDIQAFIDLHWQKGHILASNLELLSWQHQSSTEGLNYVLAERNSELVGILGFIEHNRFDSNLKDQALSLTTWITRTDMQVTGVGVSLVRYLLHQRKPDYVSTIGIAAEAQNLLRILGFDVGEMSHHAIFNLEFRKFRIASILLPDQQPFSSHPKSRNNYRICSEDDLDSLSSFPVHNNQYWPSKSSEYMRNRFHRHPWYQYWLIRFEINKESSVLLVCRPIEANGGRILRCVDVIGNLAHQDLVSQMQPLLSDHQFEYIDFVHYTPNTSPLTPAGFVNIRKPGSPSLPGYFEPFLQKPRVLRYACKTLVYSSRHPHLFLADSDQDRPNV